MNTEKKAVRKPQQKRSKMLKEKVVSTALKLFCDKGYYNTTTNEIAKEAGISIGSLYSYFKDKDTIFMEILDQYHRNFLTIFEKIKENINHSLYEQNKRIWLRVLLDELINLHVSVKTLNRELKGLYYVKDEVRLMMDQQSEKIKAATLEILSKHPSEIHTDNLEITALLVVSFISSMIDQIVFNSQLSDADRENIIHVGIDAIFKVLYE